MSRSIKEQFKSLKQENDQINPDRVWVMENRERLMRQVENSTSSESKHFSFTYVWDALNVMIPGRMVYSVVRPMVVILLVGALATSGWIASVGATSGSLPGDLGYGVKLATEKTQEIIASVASSNDKEAQMHMEFASRRAQEVKKVVENKVIENNNDQTSKKVEDTIKRLEKSIDSANNKIKEVSEKQPEKIVETSKAVAEKTKEINANLKEAGKQEGNEGITEAKKKVAEVGLNAVEAVVRVKEEGGAEVSDEEVRDLVNGQIENILADVDEIKVQAEEAVRGLNEVNTSGDGKTDIKIDSVLMPTSTTKIDSTVEINSSTIITGLISTSTSSLAEVKTAVGEAVKKVNETGVEAVKGLADAKTLVQNNQISEAIEKVKQITGATQVTEKVITEVKKVVSSVVTQETVKQEIVNITTEKSISEENINASSTTVAETIKTIFQ